MGLPQSDEDQTGLEWVHTIFSIEPRWTVELDCDMIKYEVEDVCGKECSEVRFLAQGAFNRLFTVQVGGEVLIIRISLPVHPIRKTKSEVATIAWIQQNTALPVPKTLAFKSHRNNPIGFEWILMTEIRGQTLSSAWKSLSQEAKSGIVHQLAVYSSIMFEKQKAAIGNLYADESESGSSFEIRELVSMEFMWGHRLRYNVSHGPFASSKDWLTARLTLVKSECESKLEDPEIDDDDRDDAERTLEIAGKLNSCLDIAFGHEEALPEPSMLHHGDLSLHNIMVDDQGGLTGVVDWECVSFVPLWKACTIPICLQSRARQTRPDIGEYMRNEDGSVNELYWEHVMEYELTILRQEFVDKMRSLQPGWIKTALEHTVQIDFDFAVSNCDDEFSAHGIKEWISALTRGDASGVRLCDGI